MMMAQVRCARGNEDVGISWTESTLFQDDATLEEVLEWASIPISFAHSSGDITIQRMSEGYLNKEKNK